MEENIEILDPIQNIGNKSLCTKLFFYIRLVPLKNINTVLKGNEVKE